MRTRWSALAMGAFGVAQIGVTMGHLPGWPCPFFHMTGIPCPGCGATRACVTILRGQWAVSLRMHALGAVFLVTIALLLVAGLLPGRARQGFVASIHRFEARTSAGYLFFAVLVLYWGARLALDGHGFIGLMKAPFP